ncbi:hypothetical protein HanIR_Chr14g0694551 [Helianthus annuus]|nr:hypothetical protein HanIR_Chr14g0694551 [Helianthus annuus]
MRLRLPRGARDVAGQFLLLGHHTYNQNPPYSKPGACLSVVPRLRTLVGL